MSDDRRGGADYAPHKYQWQCELGDFRKKLRGGNFAADASACDFGLSIRHISSRIAILSDQHFTFQQAIIVVQVQQFDCRCADGRQPDNVCAAQSEMILPMLRARIEKQTHYAAGGVNRAKIGSLEMIAKRASAGEVFADGLPTVPDGNDVVKLMRVGRIVLMNQAVFATSAGSCHHEFAQLIGNVNASHSDCGKA